MKKRVLKPVVEKVLTTITVIQLMLLCCLEDFEMSAFPFLLAFVAVFVFNAIILLKFSKNHLTNSEDVL